MAHTIKLKHTSTSGKTPTTSDLELGEIGINTYDGKLFIKKDDGTASIVELSGGSTISAGDGLDFTSNVLSVDPDGTTLTVGSSGVKISDGVMSTINGKLDSTANAVSASKLATSRTISLIGDATGSTSFDGSNNVSISVVINDDSHNHVISNVDNLQSELDDKLDASAYTASDILTKIKTVDGSGSGLDADLLDGLDSTKFNLKDGTTHYTMVSTGTDTSDNYYKVFEWTFGGQYNNFNATISITGRGNSRYDGSFLYLSAEYGDTSFVNHDMKLYSNKVWYPDGINFYFQLNNTTKKATLYVRRSGTDWDMIVGNFVDHYLSGTTFAYSFSNYGTTAPTDDLEHSIIAPNGHISLWTSDNDGSGSGLDADLLDGIEGSNYARTDQSEGFDYNITAGSTNRNTDIVIRSISGDGYKAGFEAYGASQGTGYVFVGQSGSYGGGIFYNGDGTPTFATGESSDKVSFYRRNAGSNTVVMQYPHDSSNLSLFGNLLVTSGTSGDSNITIESDTDNNDESDHPSLLLKQDGGVEVWRVGIGLTDTDTSSSTSNALCLTQIDGAGTNEVWISSDGGSTASKILTDNGNIDGGSY